MTVHSGDLSRVSQEQWLKLYYFARTAFSAAWVAAAFTVGQHLGDRGGFTRGLSCMGCPRQFCRCIAQRRIGTESHADYQRRGQCGGNARGGSRAGDEHELGARSVRRMGDPVWPASTRHRNPPLEELWCAVGDDPERRAISAGRHVFHRAGTDADAAIHHQRGRICRSRRLLLPGFGGVAEREPIAAEGCIGPPS